MIITKESIFNSVTREKPKPLFLALVCCSIHDKKPVGYQFLCPISRGNNNKSKRKTKKKKKKGETVVQDRKATANKKDRKSLE